MLHAFIDVQKFIHVLRHIGQHPAPQPWHINKHHSWTSSLTDGWEKNPLVWNEWNVPYDWSTITLAQEWFLQSFSSCARLLWLKMQLDNIVIYKPFSTSDLVETQIIFIVKVSQQWMTTSCQFKNTIPFCNISLKQTIANALRQVGLINFLSIQLGFIN